MKYELFGDINYILGFSFILLLLVFLLNGKKRKQKKLIKTLPYSSIREMDVILRKKVEVIKKNDKNEQKYIYDNIPYGRVNAFLSYFSDASTDENPLYYSPYNSVNEEELREYGTLITDKGIYISGFIKGRTFIKEVFIPKDIHIKFSEIKKIEGEEKYFKVKIIHNKSKNEYYSSTLTQLITFSIGDLYFFISEILKVNIPQFLAIDNCEEKLEKQSLKKTKIRSNTKNLEMAGLYSSFPDNKKIYNEVKNNMNGARGNGYGAEYGNETIDKLKGIVRNQKVINEAQNLDENGRQKKNGADKIIEDKLGNKTYIQMKYYKTASESIGAAFSKGDALYITPDGKMMAIEVPKDQYENALLEMQKKIDKGQVPGAKIGDNAERYVKKVFFTYEQSFNLTRSLSIESLSCDLANGVINSVSGASITGLLTFSLAIWNGQDIKTAAKNSIIASLNVTGKNTAIYLITMQLSRNTVIDPFFRDGTITEITPKKEITREVVDGKVLNKDGTIRGFAYSSNIIANAADNLATKIKTSDLAKTDFGKKIGLDKTDGKDVINNTITTLVVYGPDLCRALTGKISPQQLFKNASISTMAIIGAKVGQKYGGKIGSVVGGYIGGKISKTIMDNFIEDDAKKMYRIFKEEFLDVVMLYYLNEEELNKVIENTFQYKKFDKELKKMYAAEDSRIYARQFIQKVVNDVLEKRKKITDEMYIQGLKEVVNS